MARDVILGTAGHIDHGKTALVAALTGVQLDRRPEEQARGITIDLGFTHLSVGDVRFGVVDVPGHERFVRNMLAGAAGVEVALLVVAADDGVMPQTREHLAALDLLGVTRGVVALSKADLADETTREVAALEVRDLLAPTGLRDAPVIPVSARTGEGLSELRLALVAAAEGLPDPGAWPLRLAVDRAFVAHGHGAVVTGSVTAGAVAVGDELDWHPGGGTVERVRVRGLANHGAPVDRLGRGQRAAVNLAGVPLDRLARGQDLAAPGTLAPTRVLTAQVRCLADAPRPLRHRLPVRLHVGTAEVMATLSLLDGDQVRPGERGFAQLFLADHAAPPAGAPFVLRAASAEETLGGGRVLHPALPKLRRRHVAALTQLERLALSDPAARAGAAAYFAGFAGLHPDRLSTLAAVAPGDAPAAVGALLEAGELVELPVPPRPVLVHAERVAEAEGWLLADLARRHAEAPLVTAHDRAAVLAGLPGAAPPGVLAAVAERLVKRKLVVADGRRLARADFKPKLSLAQRKLKDRLAADARAAGLSPPDLKAYLPFAQNSPAVLADVLEVAVAEGLLVKLTPELYLAPDALQAAAETVRARLLAAPAGATAADIRDWLGTTRKYSIPLCEYFDRAGVTRREGDLRVLAAPRAPLPAG